MKSEIIRPLAGDRIELLLPSEDRFLAGALVFYTCDPSDGAAPESGDDTELEAGVIDSAQSTMVMVHKHV